MEVFQDPMSNHHGILNELEENHPIGLIHVYTGDGKGKTTAAIGLGIRFIGTGKKVFMIQFYKSWHTCELDTLKQLELFKVFRFCTQKSFTWCLDKKQSENLALDIQKAWDFAKKSLKNEDCDMLILDEILLALEEKLIDIDDFIETLSCKPRHIEVVITGRNASRRVISIANYVSEIICRKHPFKDGVPGVDVIPARKGIDY